MDIVFRAIHQPERKTEFSQHGSIKETFVSRLWTLKISFNKYVERLYSSSHCTAEMGNI